MNTTREKNTAKNRVLTVNYYPIPR